MISNTIPRLLPRILAAIILTAVMGTGLNAADNAPVKIGVAGLTHGHVKGFLRRAAAADGVKIVGVVEPDSSLASEFA
jgi:hypothetical protein